MAKTFWQVFITRFLVTLTVILSIFAAFLYQRIETAKDMAHMAAQEALTHVDIVLNTMIDKTNMVEGFLHSFGEARMREMAERGDGKIYLDEFNLFTSMLYDSPSIRAIQLLPGGITLYSYPLKGNEQAMGDNVLERDQPRASAIFAMRSGLTVVDGPYELLQGGMSLIARNPIYYQDGSFWGFAVIILALPDVIEPLGLNDLTRQGYEFEFDFIHDGAAITIATTLSAERSRDTIEETKLLAGRRVSIKVVPQEGWIRFEDGAFEFTFFLLIALLIAYLGTRYRLSSLQLVSSLEKEKFLRLVTAQAYKEAEQANNAKSEFLSAMSHDLRTPMNAIVGLCVLLTRDMDKPQKVANYARKINASCQHLLGLINDILDMNKIESGKNTFNMREFSLATLIDNLNTIVRPQARAKKQAFEIKLQHIKHEFLIADNLRLNQILLNLLSNAVKYTQVGGHISLIVTEEEERSNNIARYTFEVIDNGMGMSQEFLARIYEPFVRADNVVGTAIQGTGLGMTITHNLVNLLGGSIVIDSKENEGTAVRVHLSLKIKNEEVKDSEFLKNHGIARILLIDDEFAVNESVSHTMSEAGVETIHAFNRTQTFSFLDKCAAEGKKIDLILLDLVLQDENGLDVAKALKDSPYRDIPIFILTSYDYSDIEVDGMDIGIKGFLMKPLFLSNLKQAIINAYDDNSKTEKADNKSVLDGMHILAAEDNELNSEILVELLSMRGAKCTMCADGVEVVEAFKKSQPGQYDFILMDVQMPRLNGLDATRQIRALDLPHAKTITIIAMTANAFTDDVKASLDAGMDYHISKPIDLDLLEDYMRKVGAGQAPNLSNSYVPTMRRTTKEEAAREEAVGKARKEAARAQAECSHSGAEAAAPEAAADLAPRDPTPTGDGLITANAQSTELNAKLCDNEEAGVSGATISKVHASRYTSFSSAFNAPLVSGSDFDRDEVGAFNAQAAQDIASAEAQAAQQLAEDKARRSSLHYESLAAQTNTGPDAVNAPALSESQSHSLGAAGDGGDVSAAGVAGPEPSSVSYQASAQPTNVLSKVLGKFQQVLAHKEELLPGVNKNNLAVLRVLSLLHSKDGHIASEDDVRQAKLLAQASMQGSLPAYGHGAQSELELPPPSLKVPDKYRFQEGTETIGYLKLAEVAAVNDIFINAMEGKGRGLEPYNPDFKQQEIAALERTAAADKVGRDHAQELAAQAAESHPYSQPQPDSSAQQDAPKRTPVSMAALHAPEVIAPGQYDESAAEEEHNLIKAGVTIFSADMQQNLEHSAHHDGKHGIKVTPELIAEATKELDELHLKVKADPTLLAEATRDLEKLRSSFSGARQAKSRGIIDAIISGTGFAQAFGLGDEAKGWDKTKNEEVEEEEFTKELAPEQAEVQAAAPAAGASSAAAPSVAPAAPVPADHPKAS